jgi:hypothetical protein
VRLSIFGTWAESGMAQLPSVMKKG